MDLHLIELACPADPERLLKRYGELLHRELMTIDGSARQLAMPMLQEEAGTFERETAVTITCAIAPQPLGDFEL